MSGVSQHDGLWQTIYPKGSHKEVVFRSDPMPGQHTNYVSQGLSIPDTKINGTSYHISATP